MMNLLLSFNFNQVINFLICFFKPQFRFNFGRSNIFWCSAFMFCSFAPP